MATTFLKRQKEMKRLEKQREKAARRAQKKLANRIGDGASSEDMNPADNEVPGERTAVPPGPESQN
ncbi:MAG: hypothetical protein ACLP1Y_04035 [Candidatus Acidiferrales bacterium]